MRHPSRRGGAHRRPASGPCSIGRGWRRRTLDQVLRSDDLFARYGAAEFAILAKDAEQRDPLALAERIRHRVATTPFVHETTPMSLTVSVGVAVLADCKH